MVLASTIVAVLFAVIAAGGEVQYAERSPSFWNESPTVIAPPPTMAPAAVGPDEPGPSEPVELELPPILLVLLRIVFYGAVAIVAATVLVYAWRNRPRLRWWRRRVDHADFDSLDDLAGALAADAQAQRDALRRGSPRNGIVECWLRLETAVVAAGVERKPSDTSAELTERVLAVHHVEPSAIAALAALYREARFSDHSMGEEARRAAIDALDAVHDSLRSGSSTVAVT